MLEIVQDFLCDLAMHLLEISIHYSMSLPDLPKIIERVWHISNKQNIF
jgi:hypothetical protein